MKEREGVGDSHSVPSFSSNRSSQQESQQGVIADALGLHMLTSTLDSGSCKFNIISDGTVTEAGDCCLTKKGPRNIFKFTTGPR